jgi:hypothetical protein
MLNVSSRKALISQLNIVNTAQCKRVCRHNVFFRVDELVLSENIQKGSLKNRMTVTRGSLTMLEEKDGMLLLQTMSYSPK